MRIASISLLRTRPSPIYTNSVSLRCIGSPLYERCRSSHPAIPPCSHGVQIRTLDQQNIQHEATGSAQATGIEHIQGNERTKSTRAQRRGQRSGSSRSRPSGLIPKPAREQRQDPAAWALLLEQYVPGYLRGQRAAKSSSGGGVGPAVQMPDAICDQILSVLALARHAGNAGTEILPFMILGSQRKAGLWLCGFLLETLASKVPARQSQRLPSNILWPKQSLDSISARPIGVRATSDTSSESCDDCQKLTMDPRYSSAMSEAKNRTMDQIWSAMASLVIQATDMPEDRSEQAMNAVQLVLGQIHNLDLMPDNVYSYHVSILATMAPRSPVVHLVSSRILTALSDAVWREQQTESIEKAANRGVSYKEIGRDPPGGRFRLKVGKLAPEVWLEFILWCCVEGGFAAAGLRIIESIHRNAEDPWFAISWSDNASTMRSSTSLIAQTSHGFERTHHLNEARHIAEVPRHTISTEVVLALIESHLNLLAPSPHSNGMSFEPVQNGIVRLVSFLEPHDLHVSYFDYVSARLMCNSAFDTDRSKMMRRWSDRLSFLKSLKTAQPLRSPQVSFRYDELLAQSEFTAGFAQQLIHSYVQTADIYEALACFNDLQKLVDNSKLHAIMAFLKQAHHSDHNFFSSRLSSGSPDFVGSHGQLPLYRLASLLELATDTNLSGFGQWLLYSTDPDGPLIPETSYGNPGIARALVRFSGQTGDRTLLKAVIQSGSRYRYPTVRFLRTCFDASVILSDFDHAMIIMRSLKSAEGGGFGLSNLAHLAGAILRLEHAEPAQYDKNPSGLLQKARSLLESLVDGSYDSRSGVFQQSVRTAFRQQVSHLLVLFQAFSESRIATIASHNAHRYQTSNLPTLSSSVFNMFLESVVEARDAKAGLELVEEFCVNASEAAEVFRRQSDSFIAQENIDMEEDMDEYVREEMHESADTTAEQGDIVANLSSIRDHAFIPFLGVLEQAPECEATKMSKQTSELSSPYSTSKLADDISLNACIEHSECSINGSATSDTMNARTEKVSNDPPLQRRTNSEDTVEPTSPPFTSPFFTLDPHSPPTSNQITNTSAFSFPSGPTTKGNSEITSSRSTPCAVYDARTIRIIVRKANQQKLLRSKSGKHVAEQNEILKWADQKFFDLGHFADMRSRELQGASFESKQPNKARFVKVRRRATFKPSQVNGDSRISRSFRGDSNKPGPLGYAI